MAVLAVQCLCSTLFYFVDIKTEIEDSSREYIVNVASLSKEEKAKSLNRIQEMFKKATENSDNKVQIAMQMYEKVNIPPPPPPPPPSTIHRYSSGTYNVRTVG